MKRIALSCSEPIRTEMAGIGVRYLELARRLSGSVAEIVLVTAGDPHDVPDLSGFAVEVRGLRPGSVAADLEDCDAVVVQGALGDQVLREIGDKPAAVDLYDPWLVENLHYHHDLGTGAYRRDHRSWTLQLARGDFFLCSSERQRCFYLGWLAAIGRLGPERHAEDPSLRDLIGLVPFGIASELPPHRQLLPDREPGERRILFGGLYDWLDPWPLLEALADLGRPAWRLLLVGNPNPRTTPQRLWRRVEQWSRQRGWWGERVQAIDWVAADRRFDLFRDVDVLVVGHRDGPETWLSLRTRVLDALATGCPVIVNEGGATAELLRRHGVGSIVPQDDPAALADALSAILEPSAAARERLVPERLLAAMSWDRALEPLSRFCRDPWRHPSRQSLPGPGVRERLRSTLDRLRRGPAPPGAETS